ncbi:Protein of unknown function [Lactobacillus helveticus CIRM-BIA 101]|nr:Protein of unknown function [Lactobacillus helveticus CIRM-BIA 101]
MGFLGWLGFGMNLFI